MNTNIKKISAVILNFKGLKDTLECINSIKKQKIPPGVKLQIIVIDNNSQDESAGILSKVKDIEFIANKKNLGFAAGCNVAVRYALSKKSDFVLILNNDTYADPTLLQNLLFASKKADIICPKIYFAKGFEYHKNRYKYNEIGKVIWYAGGKIDWENIIGKHIGVDEVDRGQFNRSCDVDFATGAAIFVNRTVFEKVGLFDEKYFLYLEDMDFCVKAKKAGCKIMYEPKAVLWHKNAQSVQGSGSRLQDYYITRNRLLFALKYASLKTKFALIKQAFTQINNPIRRKALFDFITFRFGEGRL